MNTFRGAKSLVFACIFVLVLLSAGVPATQNVEAAGPTIYGYCSRIVNRQEASCTSGYRNTYSTPQVFSAHFQQAQFNYLTITGIEVGLESDAVVYCKADCSLVVQPGDALEITVHYQLYVPKKWYMQKKDGSYRFTPDSGYSRAYDGSGVMYIYTELAFLMELTTATGGYSRSWRHLVIYEN